MNLYDWYLMTWISKTFSVWFSYIFFDLKLILRNTLGTYTGRAVYIVPFHTIFNTYSQVSAYFMYIPMIYLILNIGFRYIFVCSLRLLLNLFLLFICLRYSLEVGFLILYLLHIFLDLFSLLPSFHVTPMLINHASILLVSLAVFLGAFITTFGNGEYWRYS